MKPARLAVIGVAVVCGFGAFLLAGRKPPPQVITLTAPSLAPAPTIATEEILVMSADVTMGSILAKNKDFRWQAWPKEVISQYMIKRSDQPTAEADVDGSIVRGNFLSGEPVRKDKLIKGAGSGFLSAVLPAGMRAMAINIDSSGANAAGGFILPNDRVDILRTYKDDAGGSGFTTETVLSNIRVLAIAQTVQEENGKKNISGNTATLELDPRQVETVTLAQRTGTLSLALRSLVDHTKVDSAKPAEVEDNKLTIVRFGVSQSAGGK
jgi:pilus assembly protein CpaB